MRPSQAGNMPRAKWMSDSDYAAFERCLKHIKDKGVNKYAVCMAAIRKRKKSRDSAHTKKALRRIARKKK